MTNGENVMRLCLLMNHLKFDNRASTEMYHHIEHPDVIRKSEDHLVPLSVLPRLEVVDVYNTSDFPLECELKMDGGKAHLFLKEGKKVVPHTQLKPTGGPVLISGLKMETGDVAVGTHYDYNAITGVFAVHVKSVTKKTDQTS